MLKTIPLRKTKNIQFYSFPLLIIYCVLVFYIIPRGSVSYALLLLPILIVSVVYEIITERIKFRPSDLVITLTLLFCSVAYNYSRAKLASALILILLLFVCRFPQVVNRRKLYPLYLIALAGSIYYLMTHQHSSGVRALSVGDPNFSAYIMLLLFLFCFKNRYLLGTLLALICAFNFFSRAYFLALLVFGLAWLSERNFVRSALKNLKNFLPQRVPVILVVLFFNFIIVIYSIYYVNNNSLNDMNASLERTDLNRVTNLEDPSNYNRWLGNKQTYDLFVEDSKTFFFGLTRNKTSQIDKTAHNSLLHLIIHRGIFFSVTYLIGLGMIIRRVHQPENSKYILPPIAMSFFLHALFDNTYIMFFVVILTIQPQKGKLML